MRKFSNDFSAVENYELGRELEDGLRFVFKKFYGKDFVLPTKEQDEKEGKDGILFRIGVDFTARINGKDHCTVAKKEFDLGDGVKVQFGVRTGNSHNGGTKFPEPVLVIGVTGNQQFVYKNMLEILDKIKENLDDIFAAGEDVYWAFQDGEPI